VSSAVAFSCTSSTSSSNASRDLCNNAFLDLEVGLLNVVLGGFPQHGVNEEGEREEVVNPKMIILNLSSMLSQMALFYHQGLTICPWAFKLGCCYRFYLM
jgi:hypothetical protein